MSGAAEQIEDVLVREQEVSTEAQGNPDVEAQARRMGWRPVEEFKGDKTRWVDANEFVRRGTEELPIMRERLRKSDRQIEDMSKQLREASETLVDLTERTRRAEEAAYKRARRELEEEREQAVQSGDMDRFRRVDKDLADLAPPAPAPQRQPATTTQPAPSNTAHPDAVAWAQRNPWFYADPTLQAAAQQMHVALMSAEPDLSVAENLERVTAGMAQMYPGRVQAPRASGDGDGRRQTVVSRSSITEGRAPRDAKTFESLPKESRDAFKRYEKMIAGKGKPLTKEEWTREYYAQFQE